MKPLVTCGEYGVIVRVRVTRRYPLVGAICRRLVWCFDGETLILRRQYHRSKGAANKSPSSVAGSLPA